MSIRIRYVLSLLLGFVVVGCGGTRGPSQTEVERYLQSTVPDYVELNDVRCENFMGEKSASGRISCAGTVVLNQDLWKSNNQVFWDQLKSEFGGDYTLHSKVLGEVHVIEVASAKGLERSFESTIFAEKTVDGWRFSERSGLTGFTGKPRDRMNPGSVVVGEAAYEAMLQKVRDERARFLDLKQEFASTIEQFFLPGETITIFNNYEKQPAIRIRVTAAPTWRHKGARESDFVVPGEAVYLSKVAVNNNWASIKEGQTAEAEFRGEIVYRGENAARPGWQSRVQLYSTGASQTRSKGRIEELSGFQFVESADWEAEEKMFRNLNKSSWIRNQ